MTFQNLSLNALTVGVVAGGSVNLTAEVMVPFLTNSVEIPKCAELMLQLDQVKQEPNHRKRSWKDSMAEESRAAEKQKRNIEKAARKGTAESSGAFIDI